MLLFFKSISFLPKALVYKSSLLIFEIQRYIIIIIIIVIIIIINIYIVLNPLFVHGALHKKDI